MRNTLIITLVLFSLDLYSQIENRKDWPEAAQTDFELLRQQDIDTFLIYYENYGSWNLLPDSCNNVPYVVFLWVKKGKYFAKQSYCDSLSKNVILNISSEPISFFLNHYNDFKQRETYFKKTRNITLPPADDFYEYLVYMTSSNCVNLNVSKFQRTHKDWNQMVWIKSTINTIDIIRKEINKSVRVF